MTWGHDEGVLMIDPFPSSGLWRLTSGQRAQSWSLPQEEFGMPEGLQCGCRYVPPLWGTFGVI